MPQVGPTKSRYQRAEMVNGPVREKREFERRSFDAQDGAGFCRRYVRVAENACSARGEQTAHGNLTPVLCVLQEAEMQPEFVLVRMLDSK